MLPKHEFQSCHLSRSSYWNSHKSHHNPLKVYSLHSGSCLYREILKWFKLTKISWNFHIIWKVQSKTFYRYKAYAGDIRKAKSIIFRKQIKTCSELGLGLLRRLRFWFWLGFRFRIGFPYQNRFRNFVNRIGNFVNRCRPEQNSSLQTETGVLRRTFRFTYNSCIHIYFWNLSPTFWLRIFLQFSKFSPFCCDTQTRNFWP